MSNHIRYEGNPNLDSTESLGLRAFNIIPGATFMLVDEPDPRVWVAEKVSRDANHETVSVWAHDASESFTESDLAGERAFVLDYNSTVALVGLVVNHDDLHDTDWGTV